MSLRQTIVSSNYVPSLKESVPKDILRFSDYQPTLTTPAGYARIAGRIGQESSFVERLKMLTICGSSSLAFCDKASRRSFLKIGGLGVGGLSLPQLLRAESANNSNSSQKSVIMVYLPGGPPHQDMVDLKVDAPSEIRGEFRPIATAVPGVHICEYLPRLAKIADRLAIIRSMVGAKDRHESFQCMTGRLNERNPPGGWPEIGSVISKVQGTSNSSSAAYVNLSPKMRHRPYNFGHPSFLGVAHTPFMPLGDIKEDMVLNGISIDRLADRRKLLASVDSFRRLADGSGALDGIDAFQQRAFNILTSGEMLQALDISSEDTKLRERYGIGTDKEQGDAAPRLNEQFLLARRLIEAGVRVVTLSYSFWDWHGNNFKNAKDNFPDFDQALSALIEDLEQRGMLDDTTVIAWGEFGRSPKINKDAGRDHWPNVSCALLAGGGMRTGQVIGATDRFGAEVASRPVSFQEVFATLYNNLGINASTTTVSDYTGRPHYLVDDDVQPIRELI